MCKKFVWLGLLLPVCLLLAACSSHAEKSAVFNVDTGDKIRVEVDLKAGYDLTMEVPFTISKDENEILYGSFGQPEAYDLYYQLVEEDPNSTLLAEGDKDGGEYFFYTVNHADGQPTEYNYFLKVANSQTVVVLGSLAGREEAEAAFAAVGISLADE